MKKPENIEGILLAIAGAILGLFKAGYDRRKTEREIDKKVNERLQKIEQKQIEKQKDKED